MKRKISIIIMALLVSLVVSSCKKDTTKYTDIYLDEHPEQIKIVGGKTDAFKIHTGKYNYSCTDTDSPIYLECNTDDYCSVRVDDSSGVLKADTTYVKYLKPLTNIIQGEEYTFTVVYRPIDFKEGFYNKICVLSGAFDDDIWLDEFSNDYKYKMLPGLTKIYVKFICKDVFSYDGEIWDKNLEEKNFVFLKNGVMKVEFLDKRLELVNSDLPDNCYYFYDGKVKEIIINNKTDEEINSSLSFISQKHDIEIDSNEVTINVNEPKYVRFTESGWYKITGSGFDFSIEMSRSLFQRERKNDSDPYYIFIDVYSEAGVMDSSREYLDIKGQDRYILIKSKESQEINIAKESDERMAPFMVRHKNGSSDNNWINNDIEYKYYMPKGHKIIRNTDIYKYLDDESECYDPENVRITTSPGVKYSFVIIGARRAILFEHEDLEYEGYIYVKLSYIGDK